MRACEAPGCSSSLEGRRTSCRFCSASCRARAFKSTSKGSSTSEAKATLATVPRASQPRRGGAYTDEEIEEGLTALALCSGNVTRASKELEQVGLTIPRKTLSDWKGNAHAGRFRRIQAQVQPEISARIAETAEAIARRLTDVEWKAVEKIEAELPGMNGTQAATALQRLTWSKGVNIDKSRLYRNEPTEISAGPTLADVASSIHVLATKFGHVLPPELAAELQERDRANREAIEATATENDGTSDPSGVATRH